jgi:putative flippase GtrA
MHHGLRQNKANVRSQFFRFAIAGIAGLIVDAGLLWLMLWIGLGYFAGRAVSFLVAVWVTWQLNRQFTFSGKQYESVWREWWRYLTAMLAGGCVNYAAYSVVVLNLPPRVFVPYIGVAAGSLAGLAINFTSARWWVFRHKSEQ